MENLQIHSRSYIVRWVHVAEAHSITWSVQPHKKSVNFGIFKHPGNKQNLAPPNLSSQESLDAPDTLALPQPDEDARKRRGSVARHGNNSIIEKLQQIGLRCVDWVGNCEADKVSMGTYDVPKGQEGTYGLVFDNTFSKTVAKTATFVLMTHPTNAPPKSKVLPTPNSQTATTPDPSNPTGGPKTSAQKPDGQSTESLPQNTGLQPVVDAGSTKPMRRNTIGRDLDIHDIHTGILWKKRRKRGQGWAKRFFSLDFTSSTLSYYYNSHSSALRGAVPLSLAAIGADEKTKEFSIDSGAEVWHLKANNMSEFEVWKDALERASKASINTPGPVTPSVASFSASPFVSAPAEHLSNQEWEQAEGLLSRISGSRDALRRLTQDTDPKYAPNIVNANGFGSHAASSAESVTSPAAVETDEDPFEKPFERRPSFWTRKSSASNTPQSASKKKTTNQQLAVPNTPTVQQISPMPGQLNPSKTRPGTAQSAHLPVETVHERCLALLKDLDAVVTDFSALLTQTKSRRRSVVPSAEPRMSRMSIDSIASDEFFDAEDIPPEDESRTPSNLLAIRRSSDQLSEPVEEPTDAMSDAGDSDASSDAGDTNATSSSSISGAVAASPAAASLFPDKPRSLSSTMASQTQHRTSIPPPKQPPPSLVSFLRKNAGKDLSTVSMPVSANEPLSALQRLAEPFESVSLLHSAASFTQPDQAADRLLYVAAFAVATFAGNRVKERAQRKPFNPMLGETYELVRSDLGFRFVSEKVVHRPVRMAWQADSLKGAWSLSQSAQPTQKFWGKSAELNTEGRMRLVLHSIGESGEHYSWVLAPAFLRNVIAGEKYIEPTSSMTVTNETTGTKAVATFKAGSLFSGRSEDVNITLHEAGTGVPMSLAAAGKWTTSLSRTDSNAVIWEAGPLVENASKNWGYTTFAAALNQLSTNDKKLLPPTDSRLRPDQRSLEDGELDEAEALKARLEERQRARRKVLETHNSEWEPRFFERVHREDEPANGEEEVWILKVGREGYWECRERNSWEGVCRVFEV